MTAQNSIRSLYPTWIYLLSTHAHIEETWGNLAVFLRFTSGTETTRCLEKDDYFLRPQPSYFVC